MRKAIFATHPGGPKIIETIAQSLDLQEKQIEASQKILLTRGNMSSATLPHIWQEILKKKVEDKTPIVSLAFGPGLSIFASLLQYNKGSL